MLDNFKRNMAGAGAPKPATTSSQHTPADRPAVASEPGAKSDTVNSTIGSSMSIVGNVICEGSVQVYGRVEGELRAPDLVVGDGAQVEGNIVAQDLTVRGRIKGTIRAVRVKLQGAAAVEGDIFHRSLSIEENALFEGSSKRVENPTDAAPGGKAKSPIAPAHTAPVSEGPKAVSKSGHESAPAVAV